MGLSQLTLCPLEEFANGLCHNPRSRESRRFLPWQGVEEPCRPDPSGRTPLARYDHDCRTGHVPLSLRSEARGRLSDSRQRSFTPSLFSHFIGAGPRPASGRGFGECASETPKRLRVGGREKLSGGGVIGEDKRKAPKSFGLRPTRWTKSGTSGPGACWASAYGTQGIVVC